MRALALTTRFREGAFEGDACLLVYDAVSLAGSQIGDDIREVVDRRPNTPRIFVSAPFLPLDHVIDSLKASVALLRVGAVPASAELAVVGLRQEQTVRLAAFSRSFSLRDGAPVDGEERPLHDELRQGWLFDLFDVSRARVDAPAGVHFGKASEKHSDKFLRTSSVLLSTAACAIIGLFALVELEVQEPRRIFVDTAPLLSVAFAMHRIASVLGIWRAMPPTKSFSSYGGVDKVPTLGRGDLVLISATTSGGLARRLLNSNVVGDLVTVFMLRSNAETTTPGRVLCDLTYVAGRTFGYPYIVNHPAATCALCARGFVLAELEGDQFLLEKRGVKRLRITSTSQPKDAEDAAELLARRGVISVRLHDQDSRCSDVEINIQPLLVGDGVLSKEFRRLLRRFVPTPINYVVLVGFDEPTFRAIAASAEIEQLLVGSVIVASDAVAQLPPVDDGNALVVVDCIADHALLRGINAQLRNKVRGGCVAYLAGMTVADSVRNLADLRIFLGYGEKGPDTFTFRTARSFMLPWSGERTSSWTQELQFLRRIDAIAPLPAELQVRRALLQDTASASNSLFLPGATGELAIAPDFVFLDTKLDIARISQADVYAVVSNLLATVRCDDKGLTEQLRRDSPPMTWVQSVYGQVLLCPSNFRDFNDAVLRASLVRAANISELNFSVDEQCSSEMLDLLVAEVAAWQHLRGDSLPELLMSLACGRMRLMPRHIERLRDELVAAPIPEYLKLLGAHIHMM